MGVIKGQNARLFVKTASGDFKAFAMAKSCTLHIANSVEETSTKDDTNDWAENEIVGKAWDAQLDNLVSLTDPGSGGELTADLMSLALAGTKVTLKFDITNGTNNRTATNSTLKLTGDAYLVDWNISAANRTSVTGSFQFTGTGPLATS